MGSAPILMRVDSIRIDGGTQSRVEIDEATVSEYADALTEGVQFPPAVVFEDGCDYWLADGFHRFHAHHRVAREDILVEIRVGTVRDALLYSLGANACHGLRRTNADKRKAVEAMLADPEWAKWTDVKIAQACGVSDHFVGSSRRSHRSDRCERTFITKHGTEAVMHTAAIGPKPAKTVEPERTPEPASPAQAQPV